MKIQNMNFHHQGPETITHCEAPSCLSWSLNGPKTLLIIASKITLQKLAE